MRLASAPHLHSAPPTLCGNRGAELANRRAMVLWCKPLHELRLGWANQYPGFGSDNPASRIQSEVPFMTLLPAVVPGTGALQAELLEDLEATATYLAREKAPATR